MVTKKHDFDLALMHLRNNQVLTAYNMFSTMAEAIKKEDPIKAALSYVLASECKDRQNKDSSPEYANAAKMFFEYAKKKKDYLARSAYLCAAKCYLKASMYAEAKESFENSKKFVIAESLLEQRPILVVDDSKAIVMKIESHLGALGYKNIHTAFTGNGALKLTKNLLDQRPIVLLDMGLPDITGNVVANRILEKRPDTQIILITADEKSTKRVKDTISSGAIAFIQKPFTLNDLKKALETAESEYSLLEK
ncbi:MAG: response regulator [Candidatus Nitrosotenuis sp.]